MTLTFEDLVEEVRSRSVEEKAVLKSLLDRALIEDRRREIPEHCAEAEAELAAGTRVFSTQIADLQTQLAAS